MKINAIRLLVIGVLFGIIAAYLCAVPLTVGQLTILGALGLLLVVTGAMGKKVQS